LRPRRNSETAAIKRIGELQAQGRGNKAVSVNTYLRCLKAFMNWCHEEQIVKEPFKLAWLKEEQKILATFSSQQIYRLVHWKPIHRSEARLHTVALTALDTGLRVSELLGLTRPDVDFQNATLRVKGKGNKHRLVPMSVELRKLLYRHLSKLRV
jgi:integrase/recombinase XerD